MRTMNTTKPADLVRREISNLVNLPAPTVIGGASPFSARWHLGHTIMSLSQDPHDRNEFRFMRFDRDQRTMPDATHIRLPDQLDLLRQCLKIVRIASYGPVPVGPDRTGLASRWSRHGEIERKITERVKE